MSGGGAMGALGGVDHFANIKPHLSVGIIGFRYRIVKSEVVNGVANDRPVDDRLFDSVSVARAECRTMRDAQVLP